MERQRSVARSMCSIALAAHGGIDATGDGIDAQAFKSPAKNARDRARLREAATGATAAFVGVVITAVRDSPMIEFDANSGAPPPAKSRRSRQGLTGFRSSKPNQTRTWLVAGR
jgi:hypothetical protein